MKKDQDKSRTTDININNGKGSVAVDALASDERINK